MNANLKLNQAKFDSWKKEFDKNSQIAIMKAVYTVEGWGYNINYAAAIVIYSVQKYNSIEDNWLMTAANEIAQSFAQNGS